jgi:hypothetical protein
MRTRIDSILTAMGLPVRDVCELPTSTKTFPDGAHYRTEELPTTPNTSLDSIPKNRSSSERCGRLRPSTVRALVPT